MGDIDVRPDPTSTSGRAETQGTARWQRPKNSDDLPTFPRCDELSLFVYPSWIYYPTSSAPPDWVTDLVGVVSNSRPEIESATHSGLTSDSVLLKLRPGLELLGYTVEVSKKRADKVRRPVLFGEGGSERVAYEVDAVHDELGASGRLKFPFEGILLFGY